MKPWMWILLAISVFGMVFGFDPIGDFLSHQTGASKQVITNVVSIVLIVGVVIYGFRKKRV
jgi:LPXTG-motif cell wall-anchored protein